MADPPRADGRLPLTILGGFLGAPVARRIPVRVLRGLIAVVGFGMTAVFFWRLINGA